MTEMLDDISLDSFVETLRRSQLLDPADLNRLAARSRSISARAFADSLVRAGELTHYQADKLLRGRWQGLVLGPYRILAPLGRGGMGTVVYLARDRRLSEALGDSVLVALKVLPNRKAVEDPKALARFRREMELGKRVNHPNVVRTAGAGDINDVHFLALDFVPGKNLRQFVREKGPLAVGDAARIFTDVASGLAHIHERGLVHRDVKPANVVVRPDGRAVLLDLGLAYAPGEPLPTDPTIVGGQGYIVGTMDYLAPEQAKNAAAVGPSADLYGLGCTLFFALTGGMPFPVEGTKQKIRRHREDPVPLIPSVPQEFARFVQHLMAKKPEMRPKSARRVWEWLEPWVTDARPASSVDAITVADVPGLDAGLWDANPGEELPKADLISESHSVEQLEDSETSSVKYVSSRNSEMLVWLASGAVLVVVYLVLLIVVLRQL